MSGFEVAGIVLGSIPLIVTAVEAYVTFMKDWGKAPAELRSLNRQLTTERAKLYNVCDQLLSDIVPQRDIEPMLQEPMGPLWQAKGANDKIRCMLWNSYAPFEKTVLEIRDALEDMMDRLKVQVTSDGQVSFPWPDSDPASVAKSSANISCFLQAEWVTKGLMTREFKKFLYRLNRKDYQDALATISKGISDLEVLTRLSVSLQPVRRKRSRGKVLNILRDLSTSIYRALRSSILCDDAHHVSLQLTTRPIEVGYEDEDEKVVHNVQFTVAISFEAADGSTRKRFWDEMNIRTAKPPGVSPPPAPPMGATSALQGSGFPAKKPKKVKGVSFSMTQTLSFIGGSPKQPPDVKVALPNPTWPATDVAFTATITQPGPTTGPLHDLCLALKGARETRPLCYGYLIDKEHINNRQFEVYPHGTAANSDTWSIVTLRDVLEQQSGLQPLTSLKEKIRLGLAIASSVLQLSKTPWLPEVPTSKNVHFFQRGRLLSYQQPFLLRTFPERPSSSQRSRLGEDNSETGSAPTMVDRNTTLFALGIMLLEIMLGSTLDKLREPHEEKMAFDGDEFGIIRDSVTALRLLEKRVALINPVYKAVVERCMGCTAGQDLDDESFRQDVYNGVVMELEEILGHTKLGA